LVFYWFYKINLIAYLACAHIQHAGGREIQKIMTARETHEWLRLPRKANTEEKEARTSNCCICSPSCKSVR